MIDKDLITQIQIVANGEKVPWQLACAIVERESAGSQWAVRFESRWAYFVDRQTYATKNKISYSTESQLQMFSYGLMQTMGSVARELGYEGPLQQLCSDASLGVTYGCRKLHELLTKYTNESDAISAYNQGSPRKDQFGKYLNQVYVDSVLLFKAQYAA